MSQNPAARAWNPEASREQHPQSLPCSPRFKNNLGFSTLRIFLPTLKIIMPCSICGLCFFWRKSTHSASEPPTSMHVAPDGKVNVSWAAGSKNMVVLRD